MGTPARTDLRASMPKVAAIVDDWRRQYGVAYVNEQIKRGLAGEQGRFYAMEAGHVLGTPFTWPQHDDVLLRSVLITGGAVAVIAPPEGNQHGAH